jgi:hypothetical protein
MVEQGKMTNFSGGTEAEALKRFYVKMAEKFGPDVYTFPALHAGIHPNASVSEHECPNPLKRRWVEHSHTSNIHFHLGNVRATPEWNHMLHVTGDIRNSTWIVGGETLMEKGHLKVLDDPEIQAIADRYPDRPGIPRAEVKV